MHHIMHCFLFIACVYSMFLFTSSVLYLFIDLTFLVLFFSMFKNSKTIKIEKTSKSLITCFVYITCEFGLVPSYLYEKS